MLNLHLKKVYMMNVITGSGTAPWNEDTQDGTEIVVSPNLSENPLLHASLVGKGSFEEFQCQAVLHFLLSLGEYQEVMLLVISFSWI